MDTQVLSVPMNSGVSRNLPFPLEGSCQVKEKVKVRHFSPAKGKVDMLEVEIRYNNEFYRVEVKQKSTVKALMNKISKIISIPPKSQKLIFKGRLLSEPSKNLTDLSIQNGDRLLLQCKTPKIDKSPALRKRSTRANTSDQDIDVIIDDEIISKGPPPNTIPGLKGNITVLPKVPFHVYDDRGNKAQLSIESDAIFVHGENREPERFFQNDVSFVKTVPIQQYIDQYSIFSIQTRFGQRTYYFLPNQYCEQLKKILTSPQQGG